MNNFLSLMFLGMEMPDDTVIKFKGLQKNDLDNLFLVLVLAIQMLEEKGGFNACSSSYI